MKHLLFIFLFSFLTSCVEQIEPIDESAEPTKILSVKADQVSQTKANILLSLELKGRAYLEYGLTQNYGQITNKNNVGLDHVFKLENLKEDTIYHYRAVVVDQNLNRVVSKNYQFKTLKKVVTPFQITEVKLLEVKQISAKVTWKTNILADGIVYFGESSNLGLSSAKISILKKDHVHELKNLKEDTTYYYQVSSKGKRSLKYKFKTLKKVVTPPSPVAPVIGSIMISSISETGAKVSWKTDKPSKSILTYGENSNLGLTKSDNSFKKDHVVTLSGLKDDQAYYLKIKVTDQDNLSVSSNQRTFRTKKKEVQINPIAPILSSAKRVGSDYVLNWKLPSGTVGTPSGGYDVWDNEVDGNQNFKTLSIRLSGLNIFIRHCFKIQARWTQVTPTQLLNSNEICVKEEESSPVSSKGEVLSLTNFRIKDSQKSRVYFDSTEPLYGSNFKGFTILGKVINRINIESNQKTGHYFEVSTPFSYWDNNTIRYIGGSDIKTTEDLVPFTLSYIKNEIQIAEGQRKIIYVNSKVARSGNGTSEAQAFKTLQEGISALPSGGGGKIWVKAGLYHEGALTKGYSGKINAPQVIEGYKNVPGDIKKRYYQYTPLKYNNPLDPNEMPVFDGKNRGGSIFFFLKNNNYHIVRNIQIANYKKGFTSHTISGFVAENLVLKDLGALKTSVRQGDGVGFDLGGGTEKGKQIRIKNSVVINATAVAFRVTANHSLFESSEAYCNEAPEGINDVKATTDYYFIMAGSYNIMRNSLAYKDTPRGYGHLGHGFTLKASDKKTEYNLIEKTTAVGLLGSYELRHPEVKYNVIKDAVSHAEISNRRPDTDGTAGVSFLMGSSDNIVERFYGHHLDAAFEFGDNTEDRTHVMSDNNTVRNSLFHDIREVIVAGNASRGTSYPRNNKFYNLTIHNAEYMYYIRSSSPIVFKNNIWKNTIFSNVKKMLDPKSNGSANGWDYQDSNFFNTSFSRPSGRGNISVDPKFVSIQKRDFDLQSSSQCIDAGEDLGGIHMDALKRKREQGRGVDIGAFESE